MSDIEKHNKFYEGQGGGTPAPDEKKGRFAGDAPAPIEEKPNLPLTTDFQREVAHVDPVLLGGDRMQIVARKIRATVGHDIDIAVTAGKDRRVTGVKFDLDGTTYDVSPRHPSAAVETGRHGIGTADPGMHHTLVITATDDAGESEELAMEWDEE